LAKVFYNIAMHIFEIEFILKLMNEKLDKLDIYLKLICEYEYIEVSMCKLITANYGRP
jgi:hypothetical protein